MRKKSRAPEAGEGEGEGEKALVVAILERAILDAQGR
jgi:hypothetical protein